MDLLRQHLNENAERYDCVRRNLTSISWASSWNGDATLCPIEGTKEADCLVTMHYDRVLANPVQWREQAAQLGLKIRATLITGRARKQVYRARANNVDANETAMVNDIIWLLGPMSDDSIEWSVSLTDPGHVVGTEDTSATKIHHVRVVRRVIYEKPEDAFSHPNARAMCRALEWILSRLEYIRRNEQQGELCLLELYCGCGAHTMAIWQANLVARVMAIEMDERLVQACRRNLVLNKLRAGTTAVAVESRTPASTVHGGSSTILDIVAMDAGQWASRQASNTEYDILLVDPPKQGLDVNVCQMAAAGTFRHVLYISCGSEALVRDLQFLSNDFEIVDCLLLDLFPQTEAVESLVHLQRKPKR
jgi:16S rRNA G966 N2-methylase RsmD